MTALQDYLRLHAEGDLLTYQTEVEAAERFSLRYADVEEAALEMDILPARYQRNRETLAIEDQLRLLRSHVAVVGCGGLGGYVVELLARLGIGHIIVIDPDVFEEHNLNRQLLSTIEAIGIPKVAIGFQRVAEINPVVEVTPVLEGLTKANGEALLKGAQVAVDALDNIPARLELAEVCNGLAIPMVHGSIAGWYGQVTCQFPGEDTLFKLLGRSEQVQGMEKILGNPSFTPALVASLEVAEVCKIILNQGTPLRGRMLLINLLNMQINEVRL